MAQLGIKAISNPVQRSQLRSSCSSFLLRSPFILILFVPTFGSFPVVSFVRFVLPSFLPSSSGLRSSAASWPTSDSGPTARPHNIRVRKQHHRRRRKEDDRKRDSEGEEEWEREGRDCITDSRELIELLCLALLTNMSSMRDRGHF